MQTGSKLLFYWGGYYIYEGWIKETVDIILSEPSFVEEHVWFTKPNKSIYLSRDKNEWDIHVLNLKIG